LELDSIVQTTKDHSKEKESNGIAQRDGILLLVSFISFSDSFMLKYQVVADI
jgi:hypothetical protein